VFYYQRFNVTGDINDLVIDIGLSSTAAEKKRLVSLIVNVSDYEDNVIELYVGREKVGDIYDKVFGTDATTGAANIQYAQNKLIELPIDLEIVVGEFFQIGIRCGGTATDLHGAYKFEIV